MSLSRKPFRRIAWSLAFLPAAFFLSSPVEATAVNPLIAAGGYTFTNFDAPNSGNAPGAGTNTNGLANNGTAVGFSITNNGTFSDFVRIPNGAITGLNFSDPAAMAFGVNNSNVVVGQQNGAAVVLPANGSPQPLPVPGVSSTAFGINDHGDIVGQYVTAADTTPGFILPGGHAQSLITVNAPGPVDTVNVQGLNNNGLAVGFYVGADGQDHGFDTTTSMARNGQLGVTTIADPRLPNVPGEPGATFVFSQILGINDNGLAVGYYGDSTTSQHGFLYNTGTGAYTFLDDPSQAFNNGVEVTQITGINDSGEIAGFYSDAAGVFHGFVACPGGQTCSNLAATPEPAALALAGLGFVGLGFLSFRKKLTRRPSSIFD